MKNKLTFFGALLVTLSLLMEYGFAGVANTYGISAPGIARGNAMTAVSKGWASAYYNLAGLAKTRGEEEEAVGSKKILDEPTEEKKTTEYSGWGEQVCMGYIYAMPVFDISIPWNKMDEDLEVDVFTMGMTTNIRKYFDRPDLGLDDIFSSIMFGMALNMNRDLKMTKINDLEWRTHNYLLYGREAEMLGMYMGMAFGFMKDTMCIGMGSSIRMTGDGRMQMKELKMVNETQSPGGSTKMDMGMEIAPLIGFYINPEGFVSQLMNIEMIFAKGFELGYTYRDELYVAFDIEGEGEMDLLHITMDMAMAMADCYVPTMHSIGLAYTPPFLPMVTLSGDLEWQLWSKFYIPESRKTFAYRKGLTVPEFDDIMIYRIGLSFKINEMLNLLAGYYDQPTFVPDEVNQGVYNLLDNNKNVYSAGIEIELPKIKGMQNPMQFSLAFQYQDLETRTVKKIRALDTPYTDGESADYISQYRNIYNPEYNYGGVNYTFVANVVIRI